MKKALAFLLIGVALLGCGVVYASGGSVADPLITLNYLNQTYIPSAVAQAGDRINTQTQKTYDAAQLQLKTKHQSYMAQLGGSDSGEGYVAGLSDQRYKQGDAISLPVGSGVMVLAGKATVSYSSGAVVDVTEGKTVSSGTLLTAMHHYLVGENTTAVVSITSETAVVSLEGSVSLSPSIATDYNALADALKEMQLFAGTGTGYGSGYDLEKIPTRIEGLIMFLRLIGEEKAAQAYTGAAPFADLPDWCTHYVAYAYSKGYTAGVGPGAGGQQMFAPSRPIGAEEYLTFVMRALGYRDSGETLDFTWQTVLLRAKELGVITAGESSLLSSSTLLRAHVVYLSYYSLDAQYKEGGSLLEHLNAIGIMDAAAVNAIRAQVAVTRIA